MCSVAHAEIKPDFLMDSDPELLLPQPVEDFDPKMGALWIEALTGPGVDMQRMAAETIARAHEYGVPDLIRSAPALESILIAESSPPSARFAAARALITLDSRDSAEKLFTASQSFGADLRQLIEPVLADWNNDSIRSVWIQRVRTQECTPRDLLLAVQGLGQVREQSARTDLLNIAADPRNSPQLRLEAAAATGQIAETGLEEKAQELALNTRAALFLNQLCAIRLLARHTSPAARQLLLDLATHEEPAVAAASLQRLNEIDVSLVLPLAESAMQNADPHVRRQGAVSILKQPSADRITEVSNLLADPNPGLRREICEELVRLSQQPELDNSIRDAAMQMLMGDSWQGQEQAALLLGTLEHKPAAQRLVALLESPRKEVRLATVWSLRKVAVPETIPALLDLAQRQTDRNTQKIQPGFDEQRAHLFEALAVLDAKQAMPMLMTYVPKYVNRNNRSRGSAIWAIGRLNEGTRNAEIENALERRIMDFSPQPLEVPIVKQMSAIALGRMKAVDQAEMLRRAAVPGDVDSRLRLALNWAVKELTGEELPAPDPVVVDQGNWFLQPIR